MTSLILAELISVCVGVAVGWGATAEHGQVSLKLREVTVPIMSNRDCKKTGYNSRITENMLCAGFPDGKKDSCQVQNFQKN